MKTYIHNQATPSIQWVVAHNLDDYPVSDVMLTENGDIVKTLPQSVDYVDANTVTVNFSAPTSGTVRLAGFGRGYFFNMNHPSDGGPFNPPVTPPANPPIVTAGLLSNVTGTPAFDVNNPGSGVLGPTYIISLAERGFYTEIRGVRPQRVTVTMTSPTDFTVVGSLDGTLGVGDIFSYFYSKISLSFIDNNAEAAPDLVAGDSAYVDLAYAVVSTDFQAFLGDLIVKETVLPNSPEASELWTVILDTPTTFTVTGSVSGAQGAGTVGALYDNASMSFIVDPAGVVTGTEFQIQFSTVPTEYT